MNTWIEHTNRASQWQGRVNGHKLKHRRFPLNIIYCEGDWALAHAAQRMWIPLLTYILKLSGHNQGHLVPGRATQTQRVEQMNSKGPFPQPFCDFAVLWNSYSPLYYVRVQSVLTRTHQKQMKLFIKISWLWSNASVHSFYPKKKFASVSGQFY